MTITPCVRPCLVRVDFNAKTIDIIDENQAIRSWKDPYYIDFDRVKTAEALLGWICHLTGKTWWTAEHARQLIYAWSEVTGKQIHFD